MSIKSPIKVTILIMDRHFLYLPLYVAEFDHPESGKRPFFGEIPSQYTVELKRQQRVADRTDAAVFETLMDARINSSDIMFAACDPTVLLSTSKSGALMAASLITSSAFWAVNHDTRQIRLISDLSSFDRIICYGPKTTSNLIARRIVKKDTGKLIVVNSTEEIRAFQEYGEGTLVISPELLAISNLVNGPLAIGEKRPEIVLELSTSKEFSNVLTTALFTRAEVVQTHPELVSGVLAALQKSLLAIHSDHPMVAECARHNFTDTFCLDAALAIARSSNVFPETIQVRRDRWQRASEFYYISKAVAEEKDKSTLTKKEALEAEQLYEKTVLDRGLQQLVNDAIADGFREGTSSLNAVGNPRRSWMSPVSLLSALVLLVVGYAAGNVLTTAQDTNAKLALGASWLAMLYMGWWSGEMACYKRPSRSYAAHWVSFAILWWGLHELIVPRAVPHAHLLAEMEVDGLIASGFVTVAGSWVIAAGIFTYAQQSKRTKTDSHDS